VDRSAIEITVGATQRKEMMRPSLIVASKRFSIEDNVGMMDILIYCLY